MRTTTKPTLTATITTQLLRGIVAGLLAIAALTAGISIATSLGLG